MPTHLEKATFVGNHAPLAGARGRLRVDDGTVVTSESDANGPLAFLVELAPTHLGCGAEFVVEAHGFTPVNTRVVTGPGDLELPNLRLIPLPPPALAPAAPVARPAAVSSAASHGAR